MWLYLKQFMELFHRADGKHIPNPSDFVQNMVFIQPTSSSLVCVELESRVAPTMAQKLGHLPHCDNCCQLVGPLHMAFWSTSIWHSCLTTNQFSAWGGGQSSTLVQRQLGSCSPWTLSECTVSKSWKTSGTEISHSHELLRSKLASLVLHSPRLQPCTCLHQLLHPNQCGLKRG